MANAPRAAMAAVVTAAAIALAVAGTAVAQGPAPADDPIPTPDPAASEDIAVLQGLDKVTARISTIDAPIGEHIRFGTLSIVARHCRKTPPEEPPESTAFVEIDDIKKGEQPVRLFSGWMFASSPALSALEHPVYDVWVVGCKRSSTSSASSSG